MSGNEEKTYIGVKIDRIKPHCPVCPNCNGQRWYRSYEAWEDIILEESDGDYYLSTGDELNYGANQTAWRCWNCVREPPIEIMRILDEIRENWAEWV